MIALFRDKSIVTIFLLAILSVVVHIHMFFHPIVVHAEIDNGLISVFINHYLKATASSVLSLLYIFIVLSQAIILNTLLNEWKMFQKAAFTTAAAYILITGCFPEFTSVSPALLNNYLIILFISLYARMYNNLKPNSLLFNIGFIISMSIFLFKANIIFLFISFLALAIIRPFRLKEWLILLIGLCVPVYLIGSILFLYFKLEDIKWTIPYFQFHQIVVSFTPWFWIKMSVLALSLFIGINHWMPNYDRMVIHIRRNWIILFLGMIILSVMPFAIYKGAFIDFWMIVPLVSCFISALFLYPKRLLVPNFIFILLLILITHSNLLMIGLIKK